MTDAHLRAHGRAGQSDGRELHVLELEIARHRLRAHADRMHGHTKARDLGDLGSIEIARVVGTVRDENDGRHRARLRAAQHVEQRVADVSDGTRRRHLLEGRQLQHVAGEREQIDVERRLELLERPLLQRFDTLRKPRSFTVAIEHAARSIEQHRHGVLLGP
jgi:hypothetical protein